MRRIIGALGSIGVFLVVGTVGVLARPSLWTDDPGPASRVPPVSQTDADAIAASNAAAATREAKRTATPISTEKSVFTIRVGDCITDPGDEAVLENVEFVPCSSGRAAYEAIDSFRLSGAVYPGQRRIDDEAYAQCPRRMTYYLFPTGESWAVGDRVITCLADR